MHPSEAEPLPPASFHPPALRKDLLDPPPPPLHPKPLGEGGGARPDGQEPPYLPREPLPLPWIPHPPPPASSGAGGAFITVDSSDSSGSQGWGGIDRDGPGWWRSAFTLGARVGTPASRSKFQGPRREGGHTGKRPDARPVLQARRGPSGVVGSPLRLQARMARALLALGPSAKGDRAHANAGGGGLGVLEWPEPEPRLARQRSVGGSARRSRRRQAHRAPSFADLARYGGLVEPSP